MRTRHQRQAPRQPRRSSFIDPETLMRIRSLELRARVVVEGFFHGLHRSPFHGFSVEFSEYREYSPGDDPRYLDWRVFARSDRYFIKRFEDETNLRCYLLVDMSPSMGYGSIAYSKGEYAKTAAATLGYFLASQRDAVGLVTFGESVTDHIPARYRPGHLHRLILSLARAYSGRSTDVGAPLEEIARVVSKRSLVVLISDLLAPLEALETELRLLRCLGHDVVVLRVLDPAETTFRFDKPALFEDLESSQELYVDPEIVRRDYLERFSEHAATIERICGSLGIDLYQLTSDRPLELALFDFVSSRLRRQGTVSRRGLLRAAAGAARSAAPGEAG